LNASIPSADHPVSPDGPRKPQLLIFDVNETLSDMAPIAGGRGCAPDQDVVRGAVA
jgi:2-haloacid dehalogenase